MFGIIIYETNHWRKVYEDYKHNLFYVELESDVKKWIEENTTNEYELDCEDLLYDEMCYRGRVHYVKIIFNHEKDATLFKLTWC